MSKPAVKVKVSPRTIAKLLLQNIVHPLVLYKLFFIVSVTMLFFIFVFVFDLKGYDSKVLDFQGETPIQKHKSVGVVVCV